jgi:hypothetical protein
MLRPVRTVRATTKEEVDAALARADQITVEGDDELLSYAVNKAARDPENQIAVELEDSGGRPLEDTGGDPIAHGPALARGLQPPPQARLRLDEKYLKDLRRQPPRRVSKTAVAVAAALAIILIIAGLNWLLFGAPTNAPHPVIGEAKPPIPTTAALPHRPESASPAGEATSVSEEATRAPAGAFSVPTKEAARVPLEPRPTAPFDCRP